MKINIIANQMRAQRGEKITLPMLQAELKEVKQLRPKTPALKFHIAALEAMITHKSKTIK